MHEGLISKGHVQGTGLGNLINHRCNCALVHPMCHGKIQGIGGDHNFNIFAKHLVYWEGYRCVREWLVSMCDSFHVAGADALRRFDKYYQFYIVAERIRIAIDWAMENQVPRQNWKYNVSEDHLHGVSHGFVVYLGKKETAIEPYMADLMSLGRLELFNERSRNLENEL